MSGRHLAEFRWSIWKFVMSQFAGRWRHRFGWISGQFVLILSPPEITHVNGNIHNLIEETDVVYVGLFIIKGSLMRDQGMIQFLSVK